MTMQVKRLKCPFCGNETFIRTTKDEIYMLDDGEEITDELVPHSYYPSYVYKCATCKKDVTDKELSS